MMRPWKTIPITWIAIPWLVLIVAGFVGLLDYEFSVGEAAWAGPLTWPAGSELRPIPGLFNLVLFAHPRCPCTRATIDELSRLMTRCRGKVSSHVCFLRPEAFPEGWERTDLWQSAEIIPGVEVLADPGGAEAELFRAATSGQVFLYDPDGQLVFEGGITASRGHAWDNVGSSAIVSLVTLGEAELRRSPVFGCSMHDPDPMARVRSIHGRS